MKTLASRCRNEWQRVVRKSFPFWQKLGIHVVPNHFYHPIPDTRTLTDEFWQRKSELVGINMNEVGQVSLLDSFTKTYKEEYDQFPLQPTGTAHQYYVNNGTFASVDGEVFYCMIRHFKPSRVCEIGSGFSTFVAAQAVLKNQQEGFPCELTAIEPYPNPVLQQGFPGLTRLIKSPVEKLPLDEFKKLQSNDILFIDSSHVLKSGSDVQHEYLEILPRLNPGVVIHAHDIFLPGEYPRDWMMKHQRFWNEQYLLQAFLCCNHSFEVLWGGSYMRDKHPDKLAQAFTSFNKESTYPGSFWMRRVN